MKRKYTELMIILAMVATTIINTYSQSNTISLQEILLEVKENSFETTNAKLNKNISGVNFQLYKSLLKPTINLGADLPNYSKTSASIIQPNGTIAFQAIQQMNGSVFANASQVITQTGGTLFAYSDIQRFDDLSDDIKLYNGVPLRIGINQPLFGFNPWKYEKKIQPLLLKEAEKQFNSSIEQALSTATQFYFDILINQQEVEIARANQEVNQKLLDITEERFVLGKVSRDEKLQLEIELNNASLALTQAQRALDNSTMTLYNYLGKSFKDSPTQFLDPELLAVASIDTDQLIASFNDNSVDIIRFQRLLSESERNLAQAKAENGLSANLVASVGFARSADKYTSIYTDPFTEQTLNLAVQVPILDWGRRKHAIKREKLVQEQIERNFEQTILELEATIRQQAENFISLQQDLTLFQNIMEIAEERARISNERYVLGNIDITNLTLAQREKDQAKRNYINALTAYWMSYYQLRILTGFDINTNNSINYN